MRKTLTLGLCALLAGCGSFPLGTSYPQQGQTMAQTQTDVLWCKDQAYTAANTPGRQAGAFLAGMTLVGAPIAFENEKQFQREFFAKCMTDKGYRVVSP